MTTDQPRDEPECVGSISGNCLNETEGFTACDTEDGECIHGGRPANPAAAEPPVDALRQRLDTLRARAAALGVGPTPEELAAGDAEDRALVPRIHSARPGVPTHHIYATLQTLRALRAYEAATLPAARTTPDNPATRGDGADNPGAQIAFRIRAELVCCRIYDRVNDTHELTIRQAMDSRDWHDLCYWGEAAARIAEAHDAEAPCGLVTPGIGATPLGPCSVIGEHDVHKAANGVCWWPAQNSVVAFTGGQTDAEIERFRTKWQEHAPRPAAVDTGKQETP